MKKLVLLMLIFGIAVAAVAQQPALMPDELKNVGVLRKIQRTVDPVKSPEPVHYTPGTNVKSAEMLGDETKIIESLYDLQSNANLSNRFWRWDDGTMAAVSTRGYEQPSTTGGWPDRGTGYNYFNGIEWGPIPSARIESERCGWPNIAPWGPNGEIVISHTATDLKINRRATKGEGAWEELPAYEGPGGTCDPTWPRIAASGQNNGYTHLFYNSYNAYEGQTNALLYSRSSDGGDTWEIQDVILEELGPDYYFGISADDYVLASRGDKVVLLCVSSWFDLFMLVSEDNGDTWEKTVIWEHPYPFFDVMNDIFSDTLCAPDNSGQVAIDAGGTVHVAFGISRVLRDASHDPGFFTSFPYWDGIAYWNENMETPIPENPDNIHLTLSPDYLMEEGFLVGWSQDVNGDGVLEFESTGVDNIQFSVHRQLGLSTMPTLCIDDNGVIALAYSTATETFMTSDGIFNYRHIWVRTSPDLGYTWGDFYDLQTGDVFHLFDECIYPQFTPKSSATHFHLTYQADNLPGVYLEEGEQVEPTTNITYYNKLLKDDVVGIDEPGIVSKANLELLSCAPNPASDQVKITVEVGSESRLAVRLINLTGQLVMEVPAMQYATGQHTIDLDVSQLQSGVYFYTLVAGNELVTNKLIIE